MFHAGHRQSRQPEDLEPQAFARRQTRQIHNPERRPFCLVGGVERMHLGGKHALRAGFLRTHSIAPHLL